MYEREDDKYFACMIKLFLISILKMEGFKVNSGLGIEFNLKKGLIIIRNALFIIFGFHLHLIHLMN